MPAPAELGNAQTIMIARYIDKVGGIASYAQLIHRDRFWQSLVQASLAYGSIVRVRRGWYATPNTHPAVIEACLARGTLTCISALQLKNGHEVTRPLHVAIAPSSSRLPNWPHVIRHWTKGHQDPATCWAIESTEPIKSTNAIKRPDETPTEATTSGGRAHR